MTLVNVEKPKKETLEEFAQNYAIQKGNHNDKNVIIDGAKWQQERMYSEEDLRNCFYEAKTPSYQDFGEWFEQFKNK